MTREYSCKKEISIIGRRCLGFFDTYLDDIEKMKKLTWFKFYFPINLIQQSLEEKLINVYDSLDGKMKNTPK